MPGTRPGMTKTVGPEAVWNTRERLEDGLESVKKTHQVAPHSGARRPARFFNSDPATSTRHQLDQTSI
jgi:hypothetical protein